MKNVKYPFITVLLLSFSASFAQITVAVDSAFSRSEQYETRKDYKDALSALNDVYSKSSYEINLRMGWLNYESGQYSVSESYYKNAIDLMPNSVEPRLGFTTAAGSLTSADDLLTQYNKILQIDPQNSLANYWTGVIYYNKKDYESADKYFEKVLNLYPFDYNSMLMEGWTKYRLGKAIEAKILFNKVLYASAKDKSAMEGLSLINDASNSTIVEQKDIVVYFNQSIELESKHDYKTAIQVMNKVYDKSSYEINLRLGWLHYEAGDNTESEGYYQKAIDLMPYSIEPRIGFAFVAAALGNTDQLIGQYNKILEIDPQNFTANYWMGVIYYNKKDYQNADKYLQKVVALYPFGYDGLSLEAWTKLKLGKSADARGLFEKVFLITPTDSQVQKTLDNLASK